MKNFEASFVNSNRGHAAKDALTEVLLDGEAPNGGLHPMIESDARTAERLATRKEGGRVEPLPRFEVTPGDPVLDAVVRGSDAYNPNQYGSGIARDIQVIAPTPESTKGLADLRLATKNIEEALNSKPFTASVEDQILAGKYRTPRIGGDGRVQHQAPTTPETKMGLKEFQTEVTAESRKQAMDDDWRRVQEIVRLQQQGPGLEMFRREPGSMLDPKLESDLAAEQRAVSMRDPEGLSRYQPAPLHERLGDLALYSKQELVLRNQGLDIIYGLRNRIRKYWEHKQIQVGLDLDIDQLEREIAVEPSDTKRRAQQRVLAGFQAQRAIAVAQTEDTFRLQEQLATAEQVWQKKFGRIPDEGSATK